MDITEILDIRNIIKDYSEQLIWTRDSVQFSCSVVSDTLQPHELQHTRPPCPSSSSRVHSNSCPLSQWCHPAISSSVVPFSSCPQSLPASESFQMSQLMSLIFYFTNSVIFVYYFLPFTLSLFSIFLFTFFGWIFK